MQICPLLSKKSYRDTLSYQRKRAVIPPEKVKSMVDRGVRFDSKLTFRDHISEKN